MKIKYLIKSLVLMACLLCSLSAAAAEAYACYTSSNTTLTFYYDNQRSSRTGTTYSLNTGNNYPDWYDDGSYASVTRVVFDSSFSNVSPTTTSCWFYKMSKLQSLTNLYHLNMSEVVYTSYMFYGCSGLTSLDLSDFNTANVVDMSYMFYNCSGLKSLNISSFNTAKVVYMHYMFSGCSGLQSLDVSGFNTSKVTDMGYMFYSCTALTDLDVSNFTTSKVTRMASMFNRCRSLKVLDLGRFNTAKVTSMNNMFMYCDNLTTIYAGSSWTTAAVTSSTDMFFGCLNIKGSKGTTYNSNYVTKTYARIDGGTLSPGYLSEYPEAYACYTSSNTTLTFYYDYDRSSRPGTTYDLNLGYGIYYYPGWYEDGTSSSVTRVVFDESFAGARPTATCFWFIDMQNLLNITGMAYLNTSEVTDMTSMFQNCRVLTSLDLSGFNTANVMYMTRMFYECRALTSLDLSAFNTAKVTDMSYMFSDCSGLTSLDLSSFNTAKVTSATSMFSWCTSLTVLDVGNFDTSKLTDMRYMFMSCGNLTTIYVDSGWTTAAVTVSTDMFYGCTKITGSKGTTYNANHTDKAYAHIDGGTANPGYLSEYPKAYACYTSSNTTLTFYYDYYKSTRPGIIYDLNTEGNDPGWYTDGNYSSVTRVVFDSSFAGAHPTTTDLWFNKMSNLQEITGIGYLNTSEVTSMKYMFYNCSSLTSINLDNFNTAKVRNMNSMFSGCRAVTYLDLSHFNTANVTDMSYMFSSCLALKNLDVSRFNTAKVLYMTSMFNSCGALTVLDLGSFNTARVRDMYGMFMSCANLTTIYVDSGWSTDAVTMSQYMFHGCTNLVGEKGTVYNASHRDAAYAHIDGGPSNPGYLSSLIPEAYVVYNPNNTTLTFCYDTQRRYRTGTTYDLNQGFNDTGWETDGTNFNVTRVVFDSSFTNARPTTTYAWFYNMQNLESIIGLNNLNTSEVTDMQYMFGHCTKLTSLDLSSFNTANVTNMPGMFYYCEKLTSLDLSSFNTAKVTNMSYMFSECSGLTSLDLSSFNTAKVTNMNYMFNRCKKLESLDLSSFNTSKVTDIRFMFSYCYGLTSLDLSSFNTEKVTDMGYLFYWCEKLESLDLSSFNTANVTDMEDMFYDCSGLTSLDLGSFNTANVTDMGGMFSDCSGLTSLDLSSFNTEKVIDMASMFSDCSGLTSLDLSSFNTANVTNMAEMFYDCSNLATIYAGSGWNTNAVIYSTYMFSNCPKIKGGKGTTYDANHVDKAYAHIDGGTSNPGYFTASLIGDINGDGSVNVADVTTLINMILNSTFTVNSVTDVNGDGSVNVADVTTLIHIILNQ